DVLDKTLVEAGGAPTEPLTGTGRPSARGTGHPTPQTPPQDFQTTPNGSAPPLVGRRNIARYWRFWVGVLFIARGLVSFAAHVPHTVGWGPANNTQHADTYTAVALAALIVLGAVLLISAGVSASRSAGAPRNQW